MFDLGVRSWGQLLGLVLGLVLVLVLGLGLGVVLVSVAYVYYNIYNSYINKAKSGVRCQCFYYCYNLL